MYLTEFIVGYMLPGRPIAMMLFKTYGYITMAQALYFLQDMKFGHYLKIPVSCCCIPNTDTMWCLIGCKPRVTFLAQAVACAWSAIVQVAVFNWALGNIEDICQPGQPNGYYLPQRQRLLYRLGGLGCRRPCSRIRGGCHILGPPLVLAPWRRHA